MPLRKLKKPRSRRRVEIGDRVRILIGQRILTGPVVADVGDIGVGGRQFVTVLVRRHEGGELEQLDWPAEELVIVRRARPAKRSRTR